MLTPVLQRVTVSGCDGSIVCVLVKQYGRAAQEVNT